MINQPLLRPGVAPPVTSVEDEKISVMPSVSIARDLLKLQHSLALNSVYVHQERSFVKRHRYPIILHPNTHSFLQNLISSYKENTKRKKKSLYQESKGGEREASSHLSTSGRCRWHNETDQRLPLILPQRITRKHYALPLHPQQKLSTIEPNPNHQKILKIRTLPNGFAKKKKNSDSRWNRTKSFQRSKL